MATNDEALRHLIQREAEERRRLCLIQAQQFVAGQGGAGGSGAVIRIATVYERYLTNGDISEEPI